jgi:hypothetical protein
MTASKKVKAQKRRTTLKNQTSSEDAREDRQQESKEKRL